MKISAFLAILLVTLAVGASAKSDGGKMYVGLDVFSVADAADEWKKEATETIDVLVNSVGYDSAGYTMKTTPGIGVRLGLLFPFGNDGDANWGASIGYVKGPSSTIDLLADSTVAGRGTGKDQIDTYFIRMLFEMRKSFPIGDSETRFSIGAGVGAAYGKIEDSLTYAGSFVTVLGAAPAKDSKTWTGVTWEINPSLIIPSGSTEIELGVRMAGFPVLKESTDFSKFSWNPFGAYAALHF